MTMNRGTYVDTLIQAQRRNQDNAFRLEKMTKTNEGIIYLYT